MRLIDTEQTEKQWFTELRSNFEDDYAKGFQAGLLAVIRQETIEAEPVRRGEWIEHFSNDCWHYDCPFCDDGYATNERQEHPENYCSNCGAKLEVRTNNE